MILLRHIKNKNYPGRLCKKEKKEFFRNLNLSSVTDNKNFWKVVVMLLFTEKSCAGGKNNVFLEKTNLLITIRPFLRR